MRSFMFPHAKRFNCVALVLCLSLIGINSSAATGGEEACVLSVSQPVLDYGQTQRAQLLERAREGSLLLVGTRTINLNLSCAGSTGMILSFKGEAAGNRAYRFAQDGQFTLKVLAVQVDGKPVIMVAQGGDGSVDASDSHLRPSVRLVPFDQNQIVRGTQLSAQVEVKAYVDDRDTQARLRSQWEGGGQFFIDSL